MRRFMRDQPRNTKERAKRPERHAERSGQSISASGARAGAVDPSLRLGGRSEYSLNVRKQEFQVRKVGRRRELGIGVRILKQRDGVPERFHGGGVVGDRELAGGDAFVSAADQFPRKYLRGFHGPQAAAVERAQAAFAPMFLD